MRLNNRTPKRGWYVPSVPSDDYGNDFSQAVTRRGLLKGDEALATLEGRPLIVHVAGALAARCNELIVSCRKSQQQPLREALRNYGYGPTVVVDYAVVGPLGGIHDGLKKSDTVWSYVVGRDFSRMDGQTLQTSASEDRR